MSQKLILASQSPRRRELLAQITPEFSVDVADIDESQLPGEAAPDYVCRLARAKAQAIWQRRADGVPVLGADTTVVIDGLLLGKPTDAEEAMAMLQRLRGREHQVLTAIALVSGQNSECLLSQTTVYFGAISDDDLQRYVASGEPMDKAGAYGIQGRAGAFVERLDGSFSGVVGLPLFETRTLLASAGIIATTEAPERYQGSLSDLVTTHGISGF